MSKSSTQFVLDASPRTNEGKGASRRLRRTGLMPAVIYGSDFVPASIELDHNIFFRMIEDDRVLSSIFTLKLEKKNLQVMLKSLQRHPYKQKVLHVDFLHVTPESLVTISIPIHFIGADKCVGVKMQGGQIAYSANEIELRGAVKNMPEFIEVDLEKLSVGEVVHLSGLKWPKGVESPQLLRDLDIPIVKVESKSLNIVEDDEDTAAVEGDGSDSK